MEIIRILGCTFIAVTIVFISNYLHNKYDKKEKKKFLDESLQTLELVNEDLRKRLAKFMK